MIDARSETKQDLNLKEDGNIWLKQSQFGSIAENQKCIILLTMEKSEPSPKASQPDSQYNNWTSD